MDYSWCHGPSCHKSHTQDRIRGVKGSKVLRTRKVTLNQWNRNSFYSKFCSNSCYNEFANKYFSGGGHKYAAGGMSELSIDDTINKLKSLIPELF